MRPPPVRRGGLPGQAAVNDPAAQERMRAHWLARHWFLIGLAVAAALGFIAPELGARGGPLRPETTTRVGVALIFFMQGLVLAPAALRSGALRWRLHLTTQLFIFAAFPLAVLALDALAGGVFAAELRTGFVYLAILPTTVAACIAYTAKARGNVAAAVFNSALANTAGVLITPTFAALLLRAQGEAVALGPMIGEVAMLLAAPLVLGQLLRPLLRRVGEPSGRVTNVLSSVIILFFVFAAFAESAATRAFAATGVGDTVAVLLVAAALFAAATGGAALLGRQLAFDDADRRTLLFCAPQKTLAAGAPLAHIIFAGHPGLGLILVPLIAYHAVQLVVGGALAERLGR
jgi:solute carrier family 10 (sodium/bile acid cotransporter), member 7